MQINEFVKLGGDQLVPYYADILGAILPCISDKEEKIRVVGWFMVLASFDVCISLCWSLFRHFRASPVQCHYGVPMPKFGIFTQ